MSFGGKVCRFVLAASVGVVVGGSLQAQTARDLVNGNLIQFSDNGAWCWYQDERAVIDTINGRLILGAIANNRGVGGTSRDGDVDVVFFDLQSRRSQRMLLAKGNSNFSGSDDHNAPAFLIRPDGKYLTFYAGHNNNYSSYFRIFDGTSWGTQQVFDWSKQRPGGVNFQTTYSNLFYLSAEGRTYNFSRGHNKSPNIMVSTNMGDSWTYGGQLTMNANVGYVNGYLKYWSNGVDRIDFVCTEYHPRDFPTSLYHGYVKGGKSYRTDGTLVDATILDTLNVPTPTDFTKVLADSTITHGDTLRRCWNIDLQRYSDGTIATIASARANNNEGGSSSAIDPDHDFIYCRYDGTKWSYTYLGKAGLKLYASEQDYTGLAALCPNDPNTIYISTTYDPRNNASLGVHEIFRGVTTDHGATWTWTPITRNSVRDNFRPIVPAWDRKSTALLWLRGTYSSAQLFDASVVGLIERQSDTPVLKTYVDATLSNTTNVDGSSLATTGPDSSAGPADGRWHQRLGIGNGNMVFASAEITGENAPTLKTRVSVPRAGSYDVWVNFWGNPIATADWRVKAGLSLDGMQLFRQMACKEVDDGDHDSKLVLTGSGNIFLYQAYLGRVQVAASNSFDVFVDDSAYQVATTGTLRGDVNRTYYDGVSYAPAGTLVSLAENPEHPVEFELDQNYPNPFNPTTSISYELVANCVVSLKVYDMLGRAVATLVNHSSLAGKHTVQWDATGLPSGVYVYRLQAGNQITAKKMILLR
ncbi:MAG TPA: T9SS type A sorting domain-containing protein [Bacteroidota bacterium]|nr:T9SS type A sorting domain-containing protein [Bacteroidota bacterium]